MRAMAKRCRNLASWSGVRSDSEGGGWAPNGPASPCLLNFSSSSSARPSSVIIRRSTNVSFGSKPSKISRRASMSMP